LRLIFIPPQHFVGFLRRKLTPFPSLGLRVLGLRVQVYTSTTTSWPPAP